MRQLIDFLVRKRHWLLFFLLEVVAFLLIYQNSTYQRTILISSANVVTGHIASLAGSVTSYFSLGEVNRELTMRNGELEMEVIALRDEIEALQAKERPFMGFLPESIEHFPYSFVAAKVVNNSVTHLSNYITINRGRKAGIEPDMGVVSDQGVVGIVTKVSDYFAVVMPMLNPKFGLSCKLAGNNYFGTLNWNGRDPRLVQLNELPRHVEFEKGDTVVTSSYSGIFPPGIIVGTVVDARRQHDDNFHALDIAPSTDFQSLTNVRVLINPMQAEQRRLESEIKER
ncbi:rod shape-determining protein MreC [Parabacteroides sp. PFB2-10]|uniref:rod shape-determining protein MreC n=1 Tax=Parabacteroides sp. PFB2-10 TaxID=1742405 RepID=UPI002476F401|nr:rod shape-determining protein MreC [Parabacteroides sp. PFB2-10]